MLRDLLPSVRKETVDDNRNVPTLDLLLSENKNEILSRTLVHREEVLEQTHRIKSNKPSPWSHYHQN